MSDVMRTTTKALSLKAFFLQQQQQQAGGGATSARQPPVQSGTGGTNKARESTGLATRKKACNM
jgi:hypothetical protein